jgi:NADH-quinone oxidoreductase subunit B
MTLQEKISQQSIRTVPWYQKDTPGEYVPIPVLGPDLVDLRQVDMIRERASQTQSEVVASAEETPQKETENS